MSATPDPPPPPGDVAATVAACEQLLDRVLADGPALCNAEPLWLALRRARDTPLGTVAAAAAILDTVDGRRRG